MITNNFAFHLVPITTSSVHKDMLYVCLIIPPIPWSWSELSEWLSPSLFSLSDSSLSSLLSLSLSLLWLSPSSRLSFEIRINKYGFYTYDVNRYLLPVSLRSMILSCSFYFKFIIKLKSISYWFHSLSEPSWS